MGICVWPILQTINFVLIPERNRVVYVSVCSLAWTSFLAYMKSLDAPKINESINNTTDKLTSQNNSEIKKQSTTAVKTKEVSN